MLEYLISLFLVASISIDNTYVNELSFTICIYLLFRFITNYRKCTLSYIECKIRRVPKEKGYLYNILNYIFDYNKKEYRFIIYLLLVIISIINFKKLKYKNIINLF